MFIRDKRDKKLYEDTPFVWVMMQQSTFLYTRSETMPYLFLRYIHSWLDLTVLGSVGDLA